MLELWSVIIFVNVIAPIKGPGLLTLEHKFSTEQSCKDHLPVLQENIDILLKKLLGENAKYKDVYLRCKQINPGTPI